MQSITGAVNYSLSHLQFESITVKLESTTVKTNDSCSQLQLIAVAVNYNWESITVDVNYSCSQLQLITVEVNYSCIQLQLQLITDEVNYSCS